ncbi:HTH-type transcriptional regulator TtgR [compost metagenome]
MCEIRQQRQTSTFECHANIALSLANAVRRGQLPADMNPERAALAIYAYIDGLIRRWLLLPESFDLLGDAELWVDTGLDMLRLSPSLRK